MPILQKETENYGQRRGGKTPSLLVLHYTATHNLDEALHKYTAPGTDASTHYVIDEDGTIYQIVPEEFRAWHAGMGSWRGERDVNSISIGIELVNPGHPIGYRPFPAEQISALIPLCHDIMKRHNIPSHAIIGHSDSAPHRRHDPGEFFPWHELAENGLGLWPTQPLSKPGNPLFARNRNHAVLATLQTKLYEIGYDIEVTGILDHETINIIAAFQRHFRAARTDGMVDESTKNAIEAVWEAARAAESESIDVVSYTALLEGLSS